MIEGENMTKTELLQYWFDEVWTKGNLDVIYQMLSPEAKANGLFPTFGLNTVDYHDLALAIRHLVKDIKIGFSHTLEQGDWLAARTVVNAKRADNDAPINLTGQVFVRFEDRKMVEVFSHYNFLSLFEQLGQIPTDVLPICLTGQRLQWA